MRERPTPRAGFSLIELVLVVAMLATLTSLLLAAVQRVREAAARVRCLDHIKQIGLALHGHHDARGHFPPRISYDGGRDPRPYMSWLTRLLPHCERSDLWHSAEAAFARDRDFRRSPPHDGVGTPVPLFACPSDDRVAFASEAFRLPRPVAFTSYLGCEGVYRASHDGVLFVDSRVRLAEVTDGLSNTLAAGERPPSADLEFGWWYAGTGQQRSGSLDLTLGTGELCADGRYSSRCGFGPHRAGPGRFDEQCDFLHFWSPHPGGTHFLFCDGSARWVTYDIGDRLDALATRSAGEPVP